jgi:hypothetical protein
VGHDEEASPAVASARFSRCEQARFCAVAQPAKACGDVGKSQIDVAFDIFGEDDRWIGFTDNSLDLRPQMARVGFASSLSGKAEWLAGVTGREDMNAAAPRSAVEGSQIVPYRRLIQGRVFHPGHESCRRVGFPLDVTDSSISGLGDGYSEIETGVACTEGQAEEFMLVGGT